MKIVALPDLHGATHLLPRISSALLTADLILLVGDLTHSGTEAEAAHVINSVRQFNPSILAVPGNWDSAQVDSYLTRERINLHRRCIVREQIALMGVGAALFSPSKTPNEVGEAELEAFLQEAAFGIDAAMPTILVCHQPPRGTRNSLTWTGLDIGSRAVRAFIEKMQPLICFTGHVHEGTGFDVIGKTQIVNSGPLWKSSYAYAEVSYRGIEAITIEMNEG